MTPAAVRVQARAVELLGAGALGIASEARPHAGVVLVGIARPGAVAVIEVPAAEYDGMVLAKLAGFTFPVEARPEQTALERAQAKIARAGHTTYTKRR